MRSVLGGRPCVYKRMRIGCLDSHLRSQRQCVPESRRLLETMLRQFDSSIKYAKHLVLTLMLAAAQLAVAQPSLTWDLMVDGGARSLSGAGSSSGYAVGTVNGVRLRIPNYYLHYGVVYEGDRRDGLGVASTAAAQGARIDNFGILLRMSTLQPIRTERDKEDWQVASARADFEKEWLMITFDNHYPPFLAPPRPMDYMLQHLGPYSLDKRLPFGLVHYESDRNTGEAQQGAGSYGHVEYFFDDASVTQIFCRTTKMVVAPYSELSFCQQHFLIPELHQMAEAFYTKKDLSRWVEIETHVKAIVHSFVVQ